MAIIETEHLYIVLCPFCNRLSEMWIEDFNINLKPYETVVSRCGKCNHIVDVIIQEKKQ